MTSATTTAEVGTYRKPHPICTDLAIMSLDAWESHRGFPVRTFSSVTVYFVRRVTACARSDTNDWRNANKGTAMNLPHYTGDEGDEAHLMRWCRRLRHILAVEARSNSTMITMSHVSGYSRLSP